MICERCQQPLETENRINGEPYCKDCTPVVLDAITERLDNHE